jgi:hypothetical protein
MVNSRRARRELRRRRVRELHLNTARHRRGEPRRKPPGALWLDDLRRARAVDGAPYSSARRRAHFADEAPERGPRRPSRGDIRRCVGSAARIDAAAPEFGRARRELIVRRRSRRRWTARGAAGALGYAVGRNSFFIVMPRPGSWGRLKYPSLSSVGGFSKIANGYS